MEKYGQKPQQEMAQHFISAYQNMPRMNLNEVEILLVEDNAHDAEMTIRALRKVNLANNLIRLKDGEEALDFLFARGQFQDRDLMNKPKVILLDIKMPK